LAAIGIPVPPNEQPFGSVKRHPSLLEIFRVLLGTHERWYVLTDLHPIESHSRTEKDPQTLQSRSLWRRNIILMPIQTPQPLQLHLFHMPVVKRHIDRSRQLFVGRIIPRHRSRSGSVTRNREYSHPIGSGADSCGQVSGWKVCGPWPPPRPSSPPPASDSIPKHRCAGTISNLSFIQKGFSVPRIGIAIPPAAAIDPVVRRITTNPLQVARDRIVPPPPPSEGTRSGYDPRRIH
jgi:hypothetical protein